MLKHILPLLLLPAIVFSNATITHDYSFGTPAIVDQAVVLEGCRPAYINNAPSVVVKPVVMLLPDNCEVSSFDVTCSEPVTLSGNFYLRPFIRGRNFLTAPVLERPPLYGKNAFFPASVKSNWHRIQYKNGHPLFVTSVNPVQYNPVTGTLRYYTKISVSVRTTTAPTQVEAKSTPAIRSQLESLVDNPEAAAKLPAAFKTDSSYEYLIVSTDTLRNYWTNFIAFNKRRAMRTQVQTMSWIKANMTGRDDAEKVRNYIIREYRNHNIVYVLLGGDFHANMSFLNMPIRCFHAKYYDNRVTPDRYYDEKDILTDIYFSCLDGDWKKNTSGVEQAYFGDPGTEDMTWDVYACRFPADLPADLANMINKTVKYSEQPVAAQVKNLFLAGQYLWTTAGLAPVYGDDYSKEYLGNCTAHRYTTYGYPAGTWTIDSLFDRNGTWTATQILNKLTTFKPAMFEHEGHANWTYAFCLTTSDVTTTKIKADGGANGNHFIITTGACEPAGFDYTQECILETFLKISTGAVAIQGFTRLGQESDSGTDGVGQRVRRYWHDAIFNPAKKFHTLEMALGNAKEANTEFVLNPDITSPANYFGSVRKAVYSYINLGDPALSIWTEIPRALQTTPTIDPATRALKVDAKGAYSWVAVCDVNGNIINTQMTGLNGLCSMEEPFLKQYFTDHPGANLKVIIKSHNYLPFETTINVSTGIVNSQPAGALLQGMALKDRLLQIAYTLEKEGMVRLSLFDAKGGLVKALESGTRQPGSHGARYDLAGLGAGVYYCVLNAGTERSVRKLVVAR